MANSPRIMVTLPTPHEATAHMARVLHEEGLLGDYVVPLSLSRLPHLPRAIESRLNLAQWRYPIPAVSGAGLQEVLTAAAFRLFSEGTFAGAGRRLSRWRAESLDKTVSRRLQRQMHQAMLLLQGNTPRASRAAHLAAGLGLAVIHQANADSWGVEEQISSLASEAADEATREDILRERPNGDGAEATKSLALATAVLTESSRIQRRVQSLVSGSTPVIALGQGVDADYFVSASRQHSPGPLLVVQVSRVGYAKGTHVLNEAVALAGSAVGRCVVAGRDADRTPLLVRQSTNLHFGGGLPKASVRDLLQQSDVFVLPTLADSMPRAVLEAMACGLPCITTPHSGYEDIIEDGVNGFIVPTGNADAVAALLRRLAEDPELRTRVGAAARATAEENTWDTFRERFRKALYAEVLPSLGAAAGR